MWDHKVTLALFAALAAVSPAWAAGATSPVVYGLLVMLGFSLIVAAVVAAWWMIELSRKKKNALDIAAEMFESQIGPVDSDTGGLVDIALIDTLRLADGVLIYVLRLNDRVLLVGRYESAITSLGDFPLSWLKGEEGQTATYRPSTLATRPSPRAEKRRSVRLARDEREWERQREELIRMLQERGE